MVSKKLDSILNTTPPATVNDEKHTSHLNHSATPEEMTRIVATVPRALKKEIKLYLLDHHEETERTVIMRGLQKLGFKINPSWLIDKRRTR